MDILKRFDKLEKEFTRGWIHRNPLLGTSLGLHDECDDKMPDGTIEKEFDDHKFLHRMLGEFQKVDPRKLPPGRAVDRDLAIHAIRNWLFDREELRFWERSPEAPRVMGQAIFQVLSRNYAPLGHRMRTIMKRLEKMPKYADQSRSKLRAPSKMFVEIELETITRLPGFFNVLKDIGREHLPLTPQGDLNRLIDQAQNALERYSDWLIVDILPDCVEEYAIGEEKFRRLLKVRGVDLSASKLASLAAAETARVRERQRETAREIRRKVPVEDIRDGLKQQHPENFDGVLRFVRDSVQKARQFVNRSKFAPLPEGEQVYVIETPGYLRHLLPFGGYMPPARFENKPDGYFFVTPGDCDSDKLKEHNYGTLANLTVRQAYPGRHLQMTWAMQHPSLLRILGEDVATAEGWSGFCEERVKEMGYDDTPSSRFMMGQSMLLGALRILLDASLASGTMTFNQAVEALIDHLAMDRICAEAEVRRYITSPGSATLPFWGRDRIKDLRKWVKDKMKARYTDAFFHAAVLQSGPLPPALLRRELEWRVTEELKKPAEKPAEEHKKDDKSKKGRAPAAAKKKKSRPPARRR